MTNSDNQTVNKVSKHHNFISSQHFLENKLKQLSILLPFSFSVFIYEKNHNLNQQKPFLIYQKIDQKSIFKVNNSLDVKFIINQDFPLLKLTEFTIDANTNSYICPLIKNNYNQKYLLFFFSLKLSSLQQELVELQVQTLNQYLDLERAYTQQYNKIEMLEYLLNSIGHELRNPLARISILIESIRLSLSQNFGLEQISLIQETIKELNDHLTYLLQWGQKNQSNVDEQDLKKVFQKSLEDLKYLAITKKIKIKYPEKTAYISIDYFQIKQIFDNLLSNGIYFSPEGETITCDWQLFQAEILVTICDRGCGLSREDMKQIFTPFYSRRNGGTGLGLALVKKIICDRRGSIWAENISEGGTKITFSLPRF